jgi:hypothetical protein
MKNIFPMKTNQDAPEYLMKGMMEGNMGKKRKKNSTACAVLCFLLGYSVYCGMS